MDFEEWLRKHEREVFKRNQGCFDRAYIFGAKQGFKAGQQSKQAEIDALRLKIQSALNAACRLQYSSGERAYKEIKELLK